MDDRFSRSLDTMLQMMALEAEKEEILQGDEMASEDNNLTISERTAKLLKLTNEEIYQAKKQRAQGRPVSFSHVVLADNDGELKKKENMRKIRQ